jgi:tetratricopeptide (TPR) repeat protein
MNAVGKCTVAALIAAGCAGPRVGRSPGQGGRPWLEIRTAHYTLQTDLSPDDARETAVYLERTRAALLAAAWPRATPPKDNIKAFVLRDDVEFQQMFGREFSGLFSRSNLTAFVLFYGKPGESGWVSRRTGTVLKHELTHHLSAYFLLRQPRWLSEGIASYFETIEISDDGSRSVMGFANPTLAGVRPARVQEVLAWTHRTNEEIDPLRLYSGAWLLVHWLMNRKLEQFSDFQQRLIKGEEFNSAWARAFEGLNLDRLNEELAQHREYHTFTVRVPAIDAPAEGRSLADAEVHALRAHLVLSTMGMFGDERVERLQFARREVDEALRQDPGNVSALYSMSRLQPALGESLAREAVAAHPESDLAWVMLAEALRLSSKSPAEEEEALKKAVSLGSENAFAANNLAWHYVNQKRYIAALPLAKRAMDLAPWSSSAWDTYALIAFGLKNCNEAISAQNRALELIPDRADRGAAKSYQARLDSYQARCQGAAATNKDG